MTTQTGVYYKVLGADGSCYHGGKGRWPLAHDGQPGAWLPRLDGTLKPCSYGYHVLRPEHLIEWLGPAIHRAEAEEPVAWDADKGVTRRARDLGRILQWNRETQLLFAADVIEHIAGLKFPPSKDLFPLISPPKLNMENPFRRAKENQQIRLLFYQNHYRVHQRHFS